MKKQKHVHISDLPKSSYPRTKGNEAKAYTEDLERLYRALSYTETKLQYSGQISIFNIKAITKKDGYQTTPDEVFKSLEDFVYHYENFCYRTFSLREKLIHFLNAIIPVGYEDKDVDIKKLIINPTIKEIGLLGCLKKFNGQQALGKVIQDRNSLTHRLYFSEKFDHYLRPSDFKTKKPEWFKEWKKQVETHVNRAHSAIYILHVINHAVTEKIIAYKK